MGLTVVVAAAILLGMALGPQSGSMQELPVDPVETVTPAPEATATPAPAAEVVEGEPIIPIPENSVVVEEVATTGIHRMLSSKLGLPVAALENMSDTAIEQLVENNARLLRVNVYRLVDDEMTLVADGGLTETETLRSAPVPIVGTNSTEAEAARSLNTAYRVYLPVAASQLSASDLQDAINRAYQYVFRLGNFEFNYGYVKEYVGYPLWIRNNSRPSDTTTFPRLVGHYYQNHNQALGKITWFAVSYDAEYMHVTFEEAYDWNYGSPFVWADRFYTADNVRYEVSVRSFNGSENVELYLHNYKVWSRGDAVPKTVSYTVTDGFPAHRYTVRHAVMLGQKIYDTNNATVQRTRLETTAGAFGFYRDIYDPIFNERTFLQDDFMFLESAFHDCDLTLNGVGSTFFWGIYPYTSAPEFGRYGYESKVCGLGRPAYIALSRLDYLAPALQAIHILNKYGNADYYYANPNVLNNLGSYITPRQMARWLETNGWNGYGIKIWGKDAAYASGVRTNVFLVLETLLGYKYNDATSRSYADATAFVLLRTQWASYGDGIGATADNGEVLRPQHRGGQLLAWMDMSAARSVSGLWGKNYAYGLPPKTILNDIIDAFSMPKEVEGVIPSNSESTLTYLQALRVYLRYKFNVSFPTALWLP